MRLIPLTLDYIAVPFYVIGYCGYKLIYKTKAVKMHEMDLTTGTREFDDIADSIDDEDEEHYRTLTFWGKVKWQLANW